MFNTRNPRFSHLALALVLAGAVGVLALGGCSSNDNPANPGGGTPGTSSFVGMFASGVQSGKLTVTVNTASLARRWGGHLAPRATVTATGTATIGTTSYPLTGTYDTGSNGIALAGGGYTFGGQFEAGTHGRPNLNGLWFGPGGSDDRGNFVCYQGAAINVKAYCGVYRSIPAAPDSGSFSFAVVDTFLVGFAHSAADTSLTAGLVYEGKVTGSGNPRTITINYTAAGQYTLLAPGTLDTLSGAVGGTYTFTDIANGGAGDDNGTYSGAVCP
jgi:hypothetical protein